MNCTELRIIKTRKPHECTWCGEKIDKGAEAVAWTCFNDGTAWTCRLHPECNAACMQDMRQLGYPDDYEIETSANPRGCYCQWEHGCYCGWERRRRHEEV